MISYKVKAKKRMPDGKLRLSDTGLTMHFLGEKAPDTFYLREPAFTHHGRETGEWRPGLLLSAR